MEKGNGRFQGYSVAGPSNYDDVGITVAQNNIETAVHAAFLQANQPVQPCERLWRHMMDAELKWNWKRPFSPISRSPTSTTSCTTSTIAALAPLVVAAVENGDVVANGLLDEAAHDLAVCVTAVATKPHLLEQSELVPIGGLLTNTTAVSHHLQAELAQQLPTCRITLAELLPILGAWLQAMLNQEKSKSPFLLNNLVSAIEFMPISK